MLLESLGDVTDGFATDQLTHCLQTATLAQLAGADDEVIVASLCHDIGKAISVPNHGAIAAEMLKPYVRPDVYRTILHHQDFQGRHYYNHFGMPTDLREKYRDEAVVRAVRAVHRRLGPDRVRSRRSHRAARTLRAAGARGVRAGALLDLRLRACPW